MKLDKTCAIFFDAGHTLLYPTQSIGSVYAQVADEFGVEADAELLDRGFKAAWEKLKVPAEELQVPRDEKLWWKQVVHETWRDIESVSQLPFDDYFENVYAAFARPELWATYPDIWPVLDWIKIRESHVASYRTGMNGYDLF